MTAGRAKPRKRSEVLPVKLPKGERMGPTAARKMLSPHNRHALVAMQFSGAVLNGPESDKPTLLDYAVEMHDRVTKAGAGDLSLASELLTAQALSLDGIFTDMARRAEHQMRAGYLQAFELYARLALKAQAQSRATVEALAKLHQPREQTVRHVHVNEGGQAIVADEFHHHTRGRKNEKAVIQSHAAGTAGGGGTLLGQDARGNGVPVAGREGPEPLPNARRHQSRRAKGKPKRLEARGAITGDAADD